MVQIRVIPCLLYKNGALVKTVHFQNEKYVGDPINTVRIFNEKEVDELIFLDILATIEKKTPDLDFLQNIASECFMPLCYGGGITSLQEMEKIFNIGVEKVAMNSAVPGNPELIKSASDNFGSQSIVVSIDVKKSILGKYQVYTHRGRIKQPLDPVIFARQIQEWGAGELLLNSIDRDGTGSGFDLVLIQKVAEAVEIPTIACGGAGSLEHFREAVAVGASAVSAGSFFVFHGKHRAVLITYPDQKSLSETFKKYQENSSQI